MQKGSVYEFGFDETHHDQPDEATQTCPECDAPIQSTTAETVCRDCGLVVDDAPIDRGPERRFDDDEELPRTGAPRTPARHDRGLSTEIGRKTDGNGRTLDGDTRRTFHRLRTRHQRAQRATKREQNEMAGLYEIRRICGTLGLEDSLRDQACRLFSTAQTEGILIGRSIEAVATACCYAACRVNGLPRTIGEFEAVAKVERPRVERAYNVLNRELELPAVPPRPRDYLPPIASACDLSDAERRTARELCERWTDAHEHQGMKPSAVAAACVYAAATRSTGLTQAAVAAVADVSVVTVRDRWHELLDLSV